MVMEVRGRVARAVQSHDQVSDHVLALASFRRLLDADVPPHRCLEERAGHVIHHYHLVLPVLSPSHRGRLTDQEPQRLQRRRAGE